MNMYVNVNMFIYILMCILNIQFFSKEKKNFEPIKN